MSELSHQNFRKHPVNHRGSGGKEYDSFQPVMNQIFFRPERSAPQALPTVALGVPPVEDNLVSTELSPVKGVNSYLLNMIS